MSNKIIKKFKTITQDDYDSIYNALIDQYGYKKTQRLIEFVKKPKKIKFLPDTRDPHNSQFSLG